MTRETADALLVRLIEYPPGTPPHLMVPGGMAEVYNAWTAALRALIEDAVARDVGPMPPGGGQVPATTTRDE